MLLWSPSGYGGGFKPHCLVAREFESRSGHVLQTIIFFLSFFTSLYTNKYFDIGTYNHIV